MPMENPRISIVLPTWNRADLLPRAIDSVIEQTVGDWELIIVDDGSSDQTPDVLKKYSDRLGQQLITIRQHNAGAGAARNAGIDRAKGEFVAFLDSDDAYLPDKLERQLKLFESQPELGMAFSDMSQFDPSGIAIPSLFEAEKDALGAISRSIVPAGVICEADIFDQMLKRYLVPTIVGMVRRDVLGEAIRFPEGQTYAEEWLFFVRVAQKCRVGYVDAPLSVHYHVQGSVTRSSTYRNHQGLATVLKEMKSVLTGLNRQQRRVVLHHCAENQVQLGWDARRHGRYLESFDHFIEATRNSWRVRWFLEAIKSFVGGMLDVSVDRMEAEVGASGLDSMPNSRNFRRHA